MENSESEDNGEKDHGYLAATDSCMFKVSTPVETEDVSKHDGESCNCCSMRTTSSKLNVENSVSSETIDYNTIVCDNDNLDVNSINLNLGKPFLNVENQWQAFENGVRYRFHLVLY